MFRQTEKPEMKRAKSKEFGNWSIEQGDYKRDDTASYKHQRKVLIKKRLKTTLLIVIYLIGVAVLSYFIFSSP